MPNYVIFILGMAAGAGLCLAVLLGVAAWLFKDPSGLRFGPFK
jgi:hypothetical protein